MECILSGGGVLSDLKMTGILVVSLRVKNCRFLSHLAVADPDLQIRGAGGAGHPDPEPDIRGGQSQKKLSSPLWASVSSKNKGGPPPLDPPLLRVIRVES